MKTNFADPAYEPTDEDFTDLIREAFAGVAAQRAKSVAELRERMARGREEALRRLPELKRIAGIT